MVLNFVAWCRLLRPSMSQAVTSGYTHPVQADDQLVAVVLVLVCACLNREVRVGPGDSWQKEVDHGPQLL